MNATPSKADVNAAFEAAATGALKGIVDFCTDPIVSIDIVHNPHSVIFDSLATMVQGNTVKVLGWYDNEWGYANRAADVAALLIQKAG